MESKPLVSVVIISCNSSRYIRETLESVAHQEYDRIELIVSDDASSDDTVSIVRNWLSQNGIRFITTHMVQSEVNTGIAANCNRALKLATGSWFKLIAADDVLLPGCVGENVVSALLHPEASVIFSRMDIIDADSKKTGEYFYPEAFFTYPPGRQLQCILHRNCLPAPAAFIAIAALEEFGGFDETYPMLEDLPLWIKLLERNRVLNGLDKTTVRYRVHNSLIYPVIGKKNDRYLRTMEAFNREVRVPLAKRLSPLLYVTVRIDILVDLIVQRPWLARVLYPVLWGWARFSPFRVKRV